MVYNLLWWYTVLCSWKKEIKLHKNTPKYDFCFLKNPDVSEVSTAIIEHGHVSLLHKEINTVTILYFSGYKSRCVIKLRCKFKKEYLHSLICLLPQVSDCYSVHHYLKSHCSSFINFAVKGHQSLIGKYHN